MEGTMIKTTTLLRTITIAAAGLIACLATPRAQAANTTIWVGSCHTGSFSTITQAIAAVPPTGTTTINVCPGYYPEQVSIVGSKFDGFTLQGVAFTHDGTTTDAVVVIPPSGGLQQMGTIIDPDEPGPALPQIYVSGATGVTISHIVVDALSSQSCNGNLIGIYYQEASGIVNGSTARNQIEPSNNGDQCGWGIAIESDSSAFTLTVSNSSVHNFQKNGIVARGTGSVGPALTATGNTVIGVGAVAGNAAQNGIEVAFGASGSVKSNYVADMIYPTNIANPSNGTGILFASATGNPTIEGNVVESANIGIATDADAGGATITTNHVGGSLNFDGIDLCSPGDSAKANVVYNSTNSAIHLDDSCGSAATGATVTTNTINDACAGVLVGPTLSPASGAIASDTYFNVFTEVLIGSDTCTPPALPGSPSVKAAQSAAMAGKPRP
jgi:hypothetical protein